MLDLFDLTSGTAVVIGGTGVLGGAMASALAKAGANVAVVGRNEERGSDRVAAIEREGGSAGFFQADALDKASLQDASAQIIDRWSTPTILINAAGGNDPSATLGGNLHFEDLELEAWDRVFDRNLVGGVLHPCQVFGKLMIEAGKGSIINVASMAGMTPLSKVAAYSAAKAAVLNLTKFLAREWASHGVRVNAISPGFFPAEQNRSLLENSDGTYTERGRQIIEHTPMARFGDPAELAGVVIWLASSQASSFVTGQNIVVDGGFSATSV